MTKKELIFFLTHHYDLNISLSLSFTFSLPISIFCHEDELEPEASHTDWYHETNRKKSMSSEDMKNCAG